MDWFTHSDDTILTTEESHNDATIYLNYHLPKLDDITYSCLGSYKSI